MENIKCFDPHGGITPNPLKGASGNAALRKKTPFRRLGGVNVGISHMKITDSY